MDLSQQTWQEQIPAELQLVTCAYCCSYAISHMINIEVITAVSAVDV